MLIIIESPNKIKKIREITKANVLATVGHFKDLPSKEIAVNLETYEPVFQVTEGKADIIKKIRAAAKGEDVFIASDPDREGYAIGTHVFEEIRTVAKSIKRAEIHEITEKGVRAAIASAVPFEQTNKGLYNAFLGRRVGDRLVGYLLSPLACTALDGKYSVGRVQSPAVRLVVEREREIRCFKSIPFWTLAILLEKEEKSFRAFHIMGKFTDHALAITTCAAVQSATTAVVISIDTVEKRQNPKPPFSTVDLQVAANSQLKIAPERAMQIAQQLFEAGLISYHRTDSLRLADEFVQEVRLHVGEFLGGEYVPAIPTVHKSKNIQDAHEAIRPTHMHDISKIPAIILGEGLSIEHQRVYELIYRRAVASQMSPAVYDATTAIFDCAGQEFKATGKVQKFNGFLAIYSETTEGDKEGEADQNLPVLVKGENVTKTGEDLAEKKTKAPARYTEGSLVKELERLGIGRPSTYASIMSVIKKRGYVSVQKSKLQAEQSGELLIDHLIETAPWVVEYDMTRKMESYLDKVESGDGARWQVFAKAIHSKMGFLKPAYRTGPDATPSPAALKYAQDVATKKGVTLPVHAESSAVAVKAFLDKYANKPVPNETSGSKSMNFDAPPSPAALKYAKDVAIKKGVTLPGNAESSAVAVKEFLNKYANTPIPKKPSESKVAKGGDTVGKNRTKPKK